MSHPPTEPTSGLATKDDLAAMEQRFTAEMTRLFARLDQRFAQIDERFARIEERLDRLEQHALNTDANFAAVSDRLDALDRHGHADQFDNLANRVTADFYRELNAQTRLLFFSMLAAVFTAASLAFAATHLG